ncbi:hypothetical protein DFQ28_003114 [Apophysomyces sp. BC1034]|nr:hypothetical protein DFQ30_005862 [Apophysomyces sp. BC1015]KAG0175460.1 hypothetical protein DFQ29_007142 [Apophysomyces sp. BC1021]KAG0189656.1 hypothetical protein DFQ28_003114 [Apophysomyces sp. BC1034]
MKGIPLSALLLVLIQVTYHGVLARLRTFHLTVANGRLNPDCNQTITDLVINGHFPAPPIRVTKNDDVHIIIHNEARDHTTIHYHGILQIGTTEADGFPNITQRSIPPGGTYHQRFRVINQAGTFFYHAHSGLQDETVQGPFIVYDSDAAWPAEAQGDAKPTYKIRDGPYEYDDERIVHLNEWWHQTETARLDYVLGDQFTGMIPADSYLINGRTVYNPANAFDNSKNCGGYSVIGVEAGKTYRLRVIGGVTFSTLGLAFTKHTMTVIEVDGVLVKPYEVQHLEVASGQRFSVLLRANQDPSKDYYISTQPYYTQATSSNGRAVLRYVTTKKGLNICALPLLGLLSKTHKKTMDPTLPVFPPGKPEWVFPELSPVVKEHDFSGKPTRTIVITPRERVMPDGTTRWFLNDHPPPVWTPPLIEQFSEGIRSRFNETAIALNRLGRSDGYDPEMHGFPMNYGETIDFVLHATTLPDGICIGHPWHTHGHVHYALASGQGAYNPDEDENLRNYPTPIAKDVTFIYPIQPGPPATVPGGTPCGWTKIRLYADNPGLWGLHCHITGHMLQGMMTAMIEAPQKIPVLMRDHRH